MGPLEKFRAATRDIGIRNACLLALSRVLDALCRGRLRIVKYYFIGVPVAPGKRSFKCTSFNFTWVDSLCSFHYELDRPTDVIAARFAQGARCLVATCQSEARIAGFLWLVHGPYDEDEVRARFAPVPRDRVAWDFDVWVAPRYRMGRLFTYLWQHAFDAMSVAGSAMSMSRIAFDNVQSLAAHRRLGGQTIGEALFVCLGRWQFMKSSISPRWHLSWRENQRPTLEIRSPTSI